jgi:hypothetical protein
MSAGPAAAFLALWNGVADGGAVPEYEVWHTFEHVPERVGSPGFVQGIRYRSVDGPLRYFTCYWLRSLDALSTPEYRALVEHPTPWSARMRGELSGFLRLPCELGATIGVSSASRLATLHLEARTPEAAARLQALLQRQVDGADLVCAHWGLCRPRDDHPIANQSPGGTSGAASLLVLLQHGDLSALRHGTEALLHSLGPHARPLDGPAYFEQLTQVHQSALQAPLSSRQPARGDLFHAFNPGDNTP